MKQFNDKIEKLKKELTQSEAIKTMIDALGYKVGEPVIYENKPALVKGFQVDTNKEENLVLQVLLVYISDENSNTTIEFKAVSTKASPDKVAPYTNAAKMLFNKG